MKINKSQNKEERILTVITIIVLIVIAFVILKCGNASVRTTTDGRINITPVQIKQIKDIGQWEFLSIEDEELVDTVSKGFFSDDELIRIYYGTLRLGVDLHKAKEGWITMRGDTVNVLLSSIELLDKDFIDEARTKPFFETGNWSQKDRVSLYEKAYRIMYKRCMTKENMKTAQQNAVSQFKQLINSMGFEHVNIQFEKEVKTK